MFFLFIYILIFLLFNYLFNINLLFCGFFTFILIRYVKWKFLK
jgi:hypothetical protein